ncbi:ribonuclease P protein component [Candidatus Saccharibacteria bacterium]|nr:ribonuclease P protein component [Candidatus Saccharibacteria bacterium]
MYAQRHRLRKSSDINRVYQRGRRAGNDWLLIRSLPNRGGASRIAIVISKKVDKRAVVRNRCRRRVREVIRLLLPDCQPGFDILVTIKTDIRNLDSEILTTEIRQQFGRLGLVHK